MGLFERTQHDGDFFCYLARGRGTRGVEWREGRLLYFPNITPLDVRRLRREGKKSEADALEADYSRLVETDVRYAVQEVRPSPEEWQRFWSLVDRLNVWEWQGDYGESIICGTPWHLEMHRQGKELSCSGNDRDHAPPGFDQFYDAMMRLAGQGK